MINKTITILLTFSFVMIISLVSCSPKYMPVYPGPKTIQLKLGKGDRVKIVTKDQREFELTVLEIGSDSIIGDSEKVQFTDISTLEKMNVSAGENALVITGKVLLISLYVAAVGASAIESDMGGMRYSGYGFGACP